MKNEIVILHISDLHFNSEKDTETATRKNILDELIKTLKDLDIYWKPEIIVISGDIGFYGKQEDYKIAKIWIDKLCGTFKISNNNLVLAPGNHDLNLDNIPDEYKKVPISREEAEKYLKIENWNVIKEWFNDFSEFSRTISEPAVINSEVNYLIGTKVVGKDKRFKFLIMNTAWFFRKDHPDNLWIGFPFLEVLQAKNQIKKVEEPNNEIITITVMHHPERYLNEMECKNYDSKPNTYNFIANHSHIILSGHTHDESPIKYNHLNDKTFIFECGATYGKIYKDIFSIFRFHLKDQSFQRKLYRYNAYDRKWEKHPRTQTCYIYNSDVIIEKQKLKILNENIILLNNLNNNFLQDLNNSYGLDIDTEELIRIGRVSHIEMFRRCGLLNFKVWIDLIKEFLKILDIENELVEKKLNNKKVKKVINKIAIHTICIFQDKNLKNDNS